MFGYLKPHCHLRSYRQIYAAICSYQRQRFGVVASLFVSYEAVFLYQLAVDCGAVRGPNPKTPTCCRLRNDWANHWQLDQPLAEFCTSLAVLLAETKLLDDRLDADSWLASSVCWWLRTAIRDARKSLDCVRPGLVDSLQQKVIEHAELENLIKTEQLDPIKAAEFDWNVYQQPTAAAFAMVFEAFGELVSSRTQTQIDWAAIGSAIGSGILIADCLHDVHRDRRSGQFNPLIKMGNFDRQETENWNNAQLETLHRFSNAIWHCHAVTLDERGTSIRIVKAAFDRVAQLRYSNGKKTTRGVLASQKLNSLSSKSWGTLFQRKLANQRTGECDCLGACCCETCCDAGAAEGVGGGCEVCCMGWDRCCCWPLEGCAGSNTNNTSAPKSNENATSAETSRHEIENPIEPGTLGTTAVRLNPSGFVTINDRKIPARSDGGWIDQNVAIVVVESKAFGLIVREVEEA